MSRNRKMAAIGTGFVYICEGSRRFRCPKNMRYRQMEPIGTDSVYICEGYKRFRCPKTNLKHAMWEIRGIGTLFVYICEGHRRFRCPKTSLKHAMWEIGAMFQPRFWTHRMFQTRFWTPKRFLAACALGYVFKRVLCTIVPSGPPLLCGCYLVKLCWPCLNPNFVAADCILSVRQTEIPRVWRHQCISFINMTKCGVQCDSSLSMEPTLHTYGLIPS